MADLPTDEARRALADEILADEIEEVFAEIDKGEIPKSLIATTLGCMVVKHRRAILASLRAKTAGGAGEWQSIETAPKDGTLFLAYAKAGQHDLPAMYSLCAWHPDAGFCIDELREPTHWKPLDPSPQGEGGGEQGASASQTEPSPTAEPKVSAARAASVSSADRPSPGLLMSMAMRKDHAIGHAGFYDRKPAGIGKPGSDPGGHARRLAGTLNSMRQLWEEAVGCGFYASHKEADYHALAETCGVTFLDSGFAVVSRANDERAQREDPKGLSPKDASVMTEGQAPQSPHRTQDQNRGGEDV